MGERYRSAFTKAELVKAATVSLLAGEIAKIGTYIVPIGEMITPGFGQYSGQESAEGRIFIDLKDDQVVPGNINGTLRITMYTPQDRTIGIISEFRTEALRDNPTDRTKQVPYPETMYEITAFRKIVLEIIPDATVTLSKANSTILVDITRVVA